MSHQLKINDKSETGKLIKVAPFRKDIRVTEPHKHNNYFEIIYLAKGSGTHSIDNNNYTVQPPIIFFVRQEQVHHWKLLTEPDGYVLILKKGFIDKSFDVELKSLLTKASSLSWLRLTEIDADFISQLFLLLTQENSLQNENTFHITEGLLKALLAKLLDLEKPEDVHLKTKSDLYHVFRELLSRDTIIKNNVAYYAGLMNTSPQNLNAACRKAVNQSAAEVLSEFIISESKRLLIYTDMTVSQISASLDFKDNSHFIKYFKRHTGQTPRSFRSDV